MKPYRLKHAPTGLYYQPHKHRGSHLSKNGKIYQTKTNGLSEAKKYKREFFRIMREKGSRVYKVTTDILSWEDVTWSYNQSEAKTRLSDWVIEEI